MPRAKKHGNDDPRGNKPRGTGMTSKLLYGNTGEGTAKADWATASPIELQRLVSVVTAQGGAVLLGYSRDRGSYRIIIMDDDGKAPVWIPCTTDIDLALEELVEQLWAQE